MPFNTFFQSRSHSTCKYCVCHSAVICHWSLAFQAYMSPGAGKCITYNAFLLVGLIKMKLLKAKNCLVLRDDIYLSVGTVFVMVSSNVTLS